MHGSGLSCTSVFPERSVKFARERDEVMASLQSETTVRESSNTTLEDIDGILDNIRDTIAKILHERGQLRRILQHFF